MLQSAQTAKLGGFSYGFDPCLPSLPAEMSVPRGLAMCLAGSAGVLLSVWACRQARPESDAELRATLVEAFGPLRPVEGRLAGVPYAPLRRGRLPRHDAAWKRAAGEAEARAEDRPSPETLANRALVHLALGEIEKAADSLEKAVKLPRPGAPVWSDLSAVRLAEAERTGDPHRLVDALAAADQAVALDGKLPEALFNRATIAGMLSLRSLAKDDWARYPKLDPDPRWVAEAERGRATLGESTAAEQWEKERPSFERAVATGDDAAVSTIAGRFTDRAQSYLEREVLPAWAEAIAAGDAEQADRWLRAARRLAARVGDLTGDPFELEAVEAIEHVPPALARDLARAHLRFARGADLYNRGNYSQARLEFAAALPGFARARSPFALAVRTQLAACDYQRGQWKKGLDDASRAIASAHACGYLGLVGHNGWMIGLIHLEGGEADLAFGPLNEALKAFQTIHDLGSEAAIHSLLANRLAYLGDADEAWRARRTALDAAARDGGAWAMTAVFAAAARIVAKEGLTDEALLFQGEVMRAVARSGDEQRIAEALWNRAAIYRKAGEMQEAKVFIARAAAEARRISDQEAAGPTLAGIAAETGKIWLDTDPGRALESFTRALDLYEDNAYSRAEILLGRARSRRKLHQDREAGRDLIDALNEYERQRGGVQPGPLRASYFETARDVLGELIALKLDSGDSDRAFDYAERAKARLLLDSLAARHLAPAKPLVTVEVARRLPRGTVLVEYSVLPDRVVAWTHGTGRAGHPIVGKAADLEKEVAELARSVTAPSGDPDADAATFERLSGELFARLIAPVLDRVPKGDALVIVPDGILRQVPFAALRDPRGGGFLVERNPLVIAPSATIFLSSRPGSSTPRERWQSLAVGNAKIDVVRYPEHGPLNRTQEEAREVAREHPGALLVESDATIPSFLAKLDRFELIHFAGHALVSPSSRAALLFAPAAAPYQAGALDVDKIAAQRLTRPRLAVLAACSAAGGSRPDLEGGADLARSFFEAGVPAVVGNLWTLGDEEATVFLDAFYKSFWRGQSATVALQEAQLAMIHHPEARFHRPAVWGGFRLLSTAAGQNLP